MSIKAFYNEIDLYCCAWLSNLMDAGHITPGVICDKSIEDIIPDELLGFDRVHMFAGIGIWDYALNQCGWGAREVWTGSCPCQPFSTAGIGAGFSDSRHLWPSFAWIIKQRRPPVVFGEQVASATEWLSRVQCDLEALDYAFGAMPLQAASAGAFHLRDRIYFVADASGEGLAERVGQPGVLREVACSSEGENSANASGPGQAWFNGPDGKKRPIEPGIYPLVDESASRVGRLRAYGNGLDAKVAQSFITAYLAS